MKNKLILPVIIIYTILCCIPLSRSIGQSSVEKENGKGSRAKYIYEHKEISQKLSGSSQIRLEKKFGKTSKTKSGSKTNVVVKPLSKKPGTRSVVNNILVNDPSVDTTDHDTQSETTILLGGGSNIIVGYNDSGSYSGSNNKFTGYSLSTDGGNTFLDRGTLPNNMDGDAGDPILARDTVSGTVYLGTLDFSSEYRMMVYRSYDNGMTFTTPVNCAPGFSEDTDFQDKDWMVVDNFPGVGRGNVYEAWTNFSNLASRAGITFTRSTDGGNTWIPNQGILIASAGSNNVQGANVVVGPDHAVYVFWHDQSAGISTPGIIKMRKSTDNGNSFGSAVTVATLTGTGTNGDIGLEFRSNSFPQAKVNPVSGNLYVVYNDDPTGIDLGNIYFVQSTTGGTNWTSPVKVNDDTGTNDQFTPAIAVKPDGTGLCISFYDRRRDPSNVLIDRYGVIATIVNDQVTFGPNFRITSQSFSPAFGFDPVVNVTYMGDYDTMDADSAYYYTSWGDNRNLSLAGSWHQSDVRFGKIPVGGPGAILDATSTSASGGNNNGVIDTNECLNFNIYLENAGTDTVTGILATLSMLSSIPGVTITQSTSAYPDIAPNTNTQNVASFALQIAQTFNCGTKLDLVVSLTTNNSGVLTIPVQVATGGIGSPLIYNNTSPVAIPDWNSIGTTSLIVVSGISIPVAKVVVKTYIPHTFVGDLTLSLKAPNGTEVVLSNQNGFNGANYGSSCGNPTVFDDTAATYITSGSAPFTGTYHPEQSLSAFNGLSGSGLNGTWSLHAVDSFDQDTGNIECWSLLIYPASCSNGHCVTEVPMSLWQPIDETSGIWRKLPAIKQD